MNRRDVVTVKKEYRLGYEAGKAAAQEMPPTDPMHQDGDITWEDLATMPKIQWPHVWRSGFIIGYYEGNESLVPFEFKGFYTHAELANDWYWRTK